MTVNISELRALLENGPLYLLEAELRNNAETLLDAAERAERLEAENERLREALKQGGGTIHRVDDDTVSIRLFVSRENFKLLPGDWELNARQALKGGE